MDCTATALHGLPGLEAHGLHCLLHSLSSAVLETHGMHCHSLVPNPLSIAILTDLKGYRPLQSSNQWAVDETGSVTAMAVYRRQICF